MLYSNLNRTEPNISIKTVRNFTIANVRRYVTLSKFCGENGKKFYSGSILKFDLEINYDKFNFLKIFIYTFFFDSIFKSN